MYRKFIHIVVFMILVVISFPTHYQPFVTKDALTFSSEIKQTTKTESSLYKKIEANQAKYAKTPQNAVVDQVWKKMPGRNGRKVNVDKSYDQMKEKGKFDSSLLVYDQVKPDVTLADLPAAPIYRGHPKKQMTALMINVSWGTKYIPHILKTLKENNVKATFFIEGRWAKDNSDFVKMIDEQGHVIGNHAYSHPNMAHLSKREATKEIKKTNDIIEAIIGKKPTYFAPPSGSFNDQTVQIADDLNMQTILWTVDTIDWKNPTVSVMVNRIKQKIHPGAFVLMHPTPSVVKGLDSIIASLDDKGLQTGTVETLLSEER